MKWGDILAKAISEGVRAAVRTGSGSGRSSGRRTSGRGPGAATPSRTTRSAPAATPAGSGRYPGDFTGVATIQYDPKPDGRPDPGEVVWAWVPYEEDHSQGKDRPALVIGTDRDWLLGLMLTSRDHDVDARQEAAAGRHWFDIGTGDWDSRGRPSEVRVDRILRLDPERVRREGGKLDRRRFDQVAAEVRRVNRW